MAEPYKTPDIQVDQPKVPVPEKEIDTAQTSKDYPDVEPLEVAEERGIDPVLESLGIEEPLHHVEGSDRDKIEEIGSYVKSVLEKRHIKKTMGNFNKVFDEVLHEMDMDSETEPYAVIDRISGVVKGWRNLGFVGDPKEKRRIFMRLARMNSSKDMNKYIFDEMTKREVWQ